MIATTLARAGLALAFIATAALAQTAPLSDAEKAKIEAEKYAKMLAEMRAAARDGAIYGYPLVELYRLMVAQAVDKASGQYKGPFNQVVGTVKAPSAKDSGPLADTTMVTATMWADLRNEPLVMTLPLLEKSRYFSIQFVDLYGHNANYVSSRTAGNAGGKFLLAGPRFTGSGPVGVTRSVRTETDFVLVVFRTQLLSPTDLENVRRIQGGYLVQPLSQFNNQPAPAAKAPDLPAWNAAKAKGIGFFDYVATVLNYAPPVADEKAIRATLAKIGVESGKPFKGESQPADVKQAIAGGLAEGLKAVDAKAAGEKVPANLYGSRLGLSNNFLNRAAGAKLGLLGDSREEIHALRIVKDADGKPLDGTKKYVLRFKKEELPPNGAYWSLAAYDAKTLALADNASNRYAFDANTLATVAREADGGVALAIQKEAPANDKLWVPAPGGPFVLVLRTYWPKEPVFSGKWLPPAAAVAK